MDKMIKNSCFLLLSVMISSGCEAQSRLVFGEQQTTVDETLRYYLYYPPGYDANADSKYPLMLFLHGGGESGADLAAIKKNGPPRMMAEGRDFPFIVLAPQNPHEKQWWNIRAVMQLLETVVSVNHVDRDRLYLTGLSRGGSACWDIAVQFPDTFAAMAVVCGMTPLPYASWIDKDMPIWVFHGTEDAVIPFSESQQMVAKLKEMGYPVKFTVYQGEGHSVWEQAYLMDLLYDWMGQQTKASRSAAPIPN
ncbi:carboxylesterase family protein [Robiginitalea sp. IMCC43444]|uniref:carboxylesterase family protein n=1 Tax=Robiginitalea sp. IMCC43444 TaxID=3459121 RepID=UPI0040418CC9